MRNLYKLSHSISWVEVCNALSCYISWIALYFKWLIDWIHYYGVQQLLCFQKKTTSFGLSLECYFVTGPLQYKELLVLMVAKCISSLDPPYNAQLSMSKNKYQLKSFLNQDTSSYCLQTSRTGNIWLYSTNMPIFPLFRHHLPCKPDYL